MSTFDLRPAKRATADLVSHVTDDQLSGSTPCPDYSVADLLDHLGGLAGAFTMAARKESYASEGGSGDGARLEPGWRDRIGGALHELGAARQEPGSFEGMPQAGPIEMPADQAALVALNEVVVHGWDLARATGQAYDPDEGAVTACLAFVAAFEAPADQDAGDGGLFGPPVPVAADAPVLARLAGATGRRPYWTP